MDNIFTLTAQSISEGSDCVLITIVATSGAAPGKVGFKLLVRADGTTYGTVGGGSLEAAAIEEARQVLSQRQSQLKEYDLTALDMCCGGSSTLFYDYLPALRTLLIFGGGHCGQALAAMARILGFRILVFDNRKQIEDRFAPEELILCDLNQLPLERIPDANAFAAIMTYNHEFDYQVLKQILTCGKSFRYIGLIGSVNKVKTTRERLQGEGIVIPENLFAPIGLRIGAQTPAEIAVAILGEIIGTYRHFPIDSMRKYQG